MDNQKIWLPRWTIIPNPLFNPKRCLCYRRVINALKNGDYQVAVGLMMYFLLITGPSEGLLDHNFTIDQLYDWREKAAQKFRDRGQSLMALFELPGVKVEKYSRM